MRARFVLRASFNHNLMMVNASAAQALACSWLSRPYTCRRVGYRRNDRVEILKPIEPLNCSLFFVGAVFVCVS